MIAPTLIALAVVFLVLGFVGVLGLVLAIALAVACIILLILLDSGRIRGRL